MTDQPPAVLPQRSRLHPAPVQPETRVEVIDVLRGFAVFGILVFNMISYSGGFQRFVEAGAPLDQIVVFLTRFLIEAKFYSLFSFLFGLGMAMQLAQAEQRGLSFAGRYLRRLFFLLLIGLAHAFFIWSGDILTAYALLGLPLLFFRRRSNRTVLIVAFSLLLIPIILSLPKLTDGLQGWYWEVAPRLIPFAGEEVPYATGSFAEITRARISATVQQLTGSIYWLWHIFAMFLFGLYAGRRRLFETNDDNLPFIYQVLFWGLSLGLAANILYAFFAAIPDRVPEALGSLSRSGLRTVGAPALCFGYAALVILLYRQANWRRRLAVLASVGRMALSNYLLQSLIATTIFYSYGLGLYGEFGPTTSLILTIAIFLFQVNFSRWWLERYRFGPAEWLWRSLTYGRLQPLRVGVDIARQDVYYSQEESHVSRLSVVLLTVMMILLPVGGIWLARQSIIAADTAGRSTVRVVATPTPAILDRLRPTPDTFVVATPVVEAVSRVPGPAAAQGDLAALALAFDVEQAYETVEILTRSPYDGRFGGSPGGYAAGDYIAARFADYGLQPAGDNGSYFQPFPIVYTILAETPQLSVTTSDGEVRRFQSRHDFSPLITRYMGPGQATGEVIWVNDCAPTDFDTIDAVGKIALCRDRLWNERQIDPGRHALEHGAVGLLLLTNAETQPLDRIGAYQAVWVPEPVPTMRVAGSVAEALLSGSGLTLDDLAINFNPFPLSATVQMAVETIPDDAAHGRNVLGVLPGRDPNYADQVVIIGGHYDHMGRDPDGTTWAGANDNASGIAALLEIARVWQEAGYVPRRTVLFAAWDAEEQGLLGSIYYVQHPGYPLEQTVGMIQLDMVGAGEETLYLDGGGPLTPRLEAIAESFGIKTVRSSIGRSDHAPFVQAGVPANMLIWFGGETSAATAHYHRPLDTIEVIQPDRLAAAGRITGLAALALAEGEPAIEELLEARATAMLQGDESAFLTTSTSARRPVDRYELARLYQSSPLSVTMTYDDLLVVGRVATATVDLAVVANAPDCTGPDCSARRFARLPVRFRHEAGGWHWDGPALVWARPTDGFVVAYPPTLSVDAAALGQTAAARYKVIAARLELPQADTTAGLMLYPDEAALRADTDLALPANTEVWVGPGVIDGQVRYVIKLIATREIAAGQVLTDSLVQLALAQAGGSINPTASDIPAKTVSWFWQGAPLVWQADAAPVEAQAQYLPDLSAALLNEADPVAAPSTEAALAWAAVDYLRQEVGWAGIGQLAAALNDGQPLDMALQAVNGQQAATFDAAWRDSWRSRLLEAQTGLAEVLTARQSAVLTGDPTALLATIAASDPTFAQEERNWAILPENMSSTEFTLTGQPAAFLADGSFLADVRIHYSQIYPNNRVTRDWLVRVRLTRTSDGYRWAGPLFETRHNESLLIYYPPELAGQAEMLLAEATSAYEQITADVRIESAGPVVIKLYDSSAALQASVGFMSGQTTTSWYRPGEAIKLALSPQNDIAAQRRQFALKLTHWALDQRIVASTSADWLYNGLALAETARLNRADADWVMAQYMAPLIRAVQRDQLVSLAEAGPEASEQDANTRLAQDWDRVEYLLNQYGRPGLQRLLAELAPGTMSMDQAMQAALGLSLAEFEANWQESVKRGHTDPAWVVLAADFDPEAVQTHSLELTKPEYSGRLTGTEGGQRAADYIVGSFLSYGLIPVGDDNTFLQRFAITYPVYLAGPRLLVVDDGGERLDELTYREDFIPVLTGLSSGGTAEGSLIWVRSEEYSSLNLRDQILLRRTRVDSFEREIAQAVAAGVAGLVLVTNRDSRAFAPKAPLPLRLGQTEAGHIPVIEITEDGLKRLLAAGGYTVGDLNSASEALLLALRVRLEIPIGLSENRAAANVLGMLPGSDPDLSHEVIIIGAHYDHVGDDPESTFCQPGGLNCRTGPGLRYPGLNDNASGIGVLLEIARLWHEAGYRPGRTVLFAAWDGQELGERGSGYYVSHPTLPLTDTIASLQLDGVGGGSGFYLQAQSEQDREGRLRFLISTAATQVEGRLDLVKAGGPSDERFFRQADIPSLLLYWKGADEHNRPEDLADDLDLLKLGTTGRTVALTLMALAR